MYRQTALSRVREEAEGPATVSDLARDGVTYITQGMPIDSDAPLDLSCGSQSSSSSALAESVTDIDGILGGGSNADAGWYLTLGLAPETGEAIAISFGRIGACVGNVIPRPRPYLPPF
jgi:hypothetical protein